MDVYRGVPASDDGWQEMWDQIDAALNEGLRDGWRDEDGVDLTTADVQVEDALAGWSE